MKLNRRNTLIGLGTIVAGGGAALGTGAFSTVEAGRDVEVGVAEDSDALLGLVAGDSDFVNDDDGVLEIELSNANLDAVTTLEDAFIIDNNSDEATDEGAGQEMTVWAEITDFGDNVSNGEAENAIRDGLRFVPQLNDGKDILGTENNQGDERSIEAGGSETIDIVIDTTATDGNEPIDWDEDNLINRITFHAEGEN
jgi:hypothetical protein